MNLRILHLSDFHFKTTDKDPVKSFNADLVTQSMIKEIASIVKNDAPFDLVIITGDLAFGGREGQYKVAEAFCQKLLGVTGLPNNKLFVIPGNHDVDRTEIKDWHLKGMYSFTTQDDIIKILADKDSFQIILRKFKEFNNFANIVSGRTLFDDNKYFYVRQVPIRKQDKSFSLNLLGLNSALFAGYDGDDKQKLAISLYQLNNALKQADEKALFSLAFFHHPFPCFHPAENTTMNMLKNNMDILLHGHLHEPANAATIDAAGKFIMIGAGASFEKREFENSFNIIDINPEHGKGSVLFYKYLHKHNCFRINYDVNPYQKAFFPHTL